ncbi:hypothetical protein AB0L40_12575 [Patulibacter sp. NPDC049589]|uniref:hypothetical protein n=1 Tax=Patulibacter sp. NPDC049589 TaxID=3154731 RepID=UPI003417A119
MSTERKQRPVKPIPDALDPAETIALEKSWLTKAGTAAIIAGILPVISFVLQTIATRGIDDDIDRTKSVSESLAFFATPGHGPGLTGAKSEIASHYGEHWTLVIGGGVASGIGMLIAAPVVYGLLRASWRRRPSFPRWFLWAPLAGGILFGIGSIVAIIYQAVQYHDFSELAKAAQTNGAANDALNSARDDLTSIRVIAGVGSLFSAIGLGAAALSAMNVGLLTRVIGSIGVLLAVLVVIPLLGQQGDFLRAFWFIALGFTILGRWPGGRPPAWDLGEAVPWPTRAQLLEEADRAGGGSKAIPESEPAPAPKPKASPGSSRKKRRK